MATQFGQSVSRARQDVEYAGFWARFAALLVDSAILVIIAVAISIASALAGAAAMVIGQIVVFIVYLLYFPVMESSARQATFGKSIVGIRVTDLDGARVSFLRAFLRNLAKIISAIPLYIGFLLAAFTARKQALHDMITKCLVVRAGPSHFVKALAAAVGGLVIAVGGGGAYVYYLVLPQMKNEITGGMQEAMKGAPAAKPAKPQVAKAPPPAAAPPPAPAAPTAAAPQPASAAPAAAAVPEPAKSAVQKPAPPVVRPPAQVAKMDGEPKVPARRRRVSPPAAIPAPAPAVALAPAPEPRVITPKYNDVMTAVMYKDEDTVNQLLDLGRWVDKPSSSGFTPLMAAVMNRDPRMVHVLLARGADPNARAPGGVTALKLARDRNDVVTTTLLEQRGAR